MATIEKKQDAAAQRRTERVLVRIPIEVKGTTPQGKDFRETGWTVVINRNGARISVNSNLRANEQVSITNLQNKIACPFRVVGRVPRPLGEGPEWGVECLEPEVNFWGILFPRKQGLPPAEETVDALLECTACRFRELAQLSLDQYREAVSHGKLSRDCPQCVDTTEWTFGFAEAEPEEVPTEIPGTTQVAPALAPPGMERRRAKRLTAKLPLRVRMVDGREAITRTENLSKTGICFSAQEKIEEGATLGLTVGYEPGGSAKEVRARVVWRKPVGGAEQFLYGVRLEETS